MNPWLRLIFVLVRAALISLGTVLVQKGLVSEAVAAHLSGDAAIWLASGIFIIVGTLAASWWEKIKHIAIARLALMYPAGTPPVLMLAALPALARASFWSLAKAMTSKVSPEDEANLESARKRIAEVLKEHGY